MEVHDKIRTLREVNQWTQEEMAEKLEMSVNGYSKIERGKSGINLDKLRQIAQIFNIDVVELLAEQNRSFFFSIGDNTNNHHNIIGSDEMLVFENEKLRSLLDAIEKVGHFAGREKIAMLPKTKNAVWKMFRRHFVWKHRAFSFRKRGICRTRQSLVRRLWRGWLRLRD
ncbi:helix-turn-helix domain-containing protein [Neisseria gonorrhoeae]|uniref:helix-turn-helix domain-containing protein n=3 Tax=Neisseria gonorrhoeae TaxID=485 RepID=UPI00203F6440|nr:helix-turn-helix transcriptional regulator [Neisseria gonorrhoeae]